MLKTSKPTGGVVVVVWVTGTVFRNNFFAKKNQSNFFHKRRFLVCFASKGELMGKKTTTKTKSQCCGNLWFFFLANALIFGSILRTVAVLKMT